MKELTFLKELMLIKQVHQCDVNKTRANSVMFLTICIS